MSTMLQEQELGYVCFMENIFFTNKINVQYLMRIKTLNVILNNNEIHIFKY
jgi:hypothetical protein